MKHRATASFWRLYRALPEYVRTQANKSFELLRETPRHPSLHPKRVGEVWSVRVSMNYRALALALENNEGFDWFWIGTHAEYDRLLR